jgi:hypothetical protein
LLFTGINSPRGQVPRSKSQIPRSKAQIQKKKERRGKENQNFYFEQNLSKKTWYLEFGICILDFKMCIFVVPNHLIL